MSFAIISGLPAFAAYFVAGSMMCVVYIFAYTSLTPNNELHLIRNGNAAAALEVGMSLIGFSIPLASALYFAGSLVDCLIWAVIALIVQLMAYMLARLIFHDLPQAIERNNIAAGIFVGCISVTAGIVNAVSMTV